MTDKTNQVPTIFAETNVRSSLRAESSPALSAPRRFPSPARVRAPPRENRDRLVHPQEPRCLASVYASTNTVTFYISPKTPVYHHLYYYSFCVYFFFSFFLFGSYSRGLNIFGLESRSVKIRDVLTRVPTRPERGASRPEPMFALYAHACDTCAPYGTVYGVRCMYGIVCDERRRTWASPAGARCAKSIPTTGPGFARRFTFTGSSNPFPRRSVGSN